MSMRSKNISGGKVTASRQDEVDRIYYNVNVVNDKSDAIFAEFSTPLTQNLLDKCDDWYCCITRFNIPGQELPLFQFETNSYLITLSFGGSDFPQFVNLPPGGFPLIFNYHEFLDYINTAFLASFTALKLAFPLAPPTIAPKYIYEPTTGLFSLLVQETYVPTIPTIEIFINTELLVFFGNTYITFYGYNQPLGKDVSYKVVNFGNNIFDNVSVPKVLAMTQTVPCTYLWNTLDSILITSGSIPVLGEYIPNLNNPSVPSTLQIITDFQPLNDNNLISNLELQFQQIGPYRLINLMTSEPLRQFDIKLFWSDKKGRILPMEIPPFNNLSIKFLFIKKESYSPTFK